MQRLQNMGCTQTWPRQGVSAFAVPADLKTNTAVFVTGSPANHDPANKRIKDESSTNNVEFKQEIFYSLCWNTPADSVVALTYSASACADIMWWTVNATYPPRSMMVLPAWFQTYRPRKGLADTLEKLADEDDTMVALYVPASLVPMLHWRDDRLDVSATLLAMLGDKGRLVTFGAYTNELEFDVVSAAHKAVANVRS